MSTDAQLSANQANAELSTGPRTAEGKAASSRNNLRHGFRSQSVLLPGDDPAEYDALLAELTQHFVSLSNPDELAELRFIREMADAEWRLRRVRRCMEDALTRRIVALTAEHPDAGLSAQASTREAVVRVPGHIELQARAIGTLGSDGGPSYGTWLRYETKYERQYDRAFKGWSDFHKALRRAQAVDADIMLKHALSRPAPLPSAQAATRAAVVRGPKTELGSNVQPFAFPPQTPRNAPCPCGSGEKYKRCCGRNAPPVLSEAA
jgi:hypothetical protein